MTLQPAPAVRPLCFRQTCQLTEGGRRTAPDMAIILKSRRTPQTQIAPLGDLGFLKEMKKIVGLAEQGITICDRARVDEITPKPAQICRASISVIRPAIPAIQICAPAPGPAPPGMRPDRLRRAPYNLQGRQVVEPFVILDRKRH